MKIEKIKRSFEYNGIKFKDPGADFTPQEVKDIFANQYPELVSAAIQEEITDNGIIYRFVRQVGMKG